MPALPILVVPFETDGPACSLSLIDHLTYMPSFQTETTPNPNSLKITTDGGRFIDEGLISASSVDDVPEETLAHRLLSIDGIADVLLLPAFLTISRTDGEAWSTLMPKVEAVLTQHFAEREDAT